MSAPRTVRIARPREPTAEPAPGGGAPTLRVNRAGTRRAVRVGSIYATAVLLLTVVLVALDLTGPNASRPGEIQGLELFLAVAAVLVAGSFLLAVSPAPRSVIFGADGVTVVGRWGTRRRLATPGGLGLRIVREFPVSWLSPGPVDVVRVTDLRGRSVTYEVERGLLSPEGPDA